MSFELDDMVEKFNGVGDFNLWRIRMWALLMYKGLSECITRDGLEALSMGDKEKAKEVEMKAHATLILSLADEVLEKVMDIDSAIELWEKLEEMFLKGPRVKGLILKKGWHNNTKKESKEEEIHKKESNESKKDLEVMVSKRHEGDQGELQMLHSPKTHEDNGEALVCVGKGLSMKEVGSIISSHEVLKSVDSMKMEEEKLCMKGRIEGSLSKDLEEAREEPRECFSCHEEGHQGWGFSDLEKLQDLVGGEVSKEAQGNGLIGSSNMVIGWTEVGVVFEADPKENSSYQREDLRLENLSMAEVKDQGLSLCGQGEELRISENFSSGIAASIQIFHDQEDRIEDHLMKHEKRSDRMLQQLKIQQIEDARVVDNHEHRKTCVGYTSTILTCVVDTFVFDPGGGFKDAPNDALICDKRSEDLTQCMKELTKPTTSNSDFLKI